MNLLKQASHFLIVYRKTVYPHWKDGLVNFYNLARGNSGPRTWRLIGIPLAPKL